MQRRSGRLMLVMAVCLLIAMAMVFHARAQRTAMKEATAKKAALVAELGLSDLCLFTEARYTRHLSAADLNTAFQDHPMSLEHFPSGSLVTPPPHIGGI